MKRTRIYTLLLIAVLLSFLMGKAYAAEPLMAGEAAILIDLSTGQCLYEKNADQQMYPASTTKMLTTLLALKHGNLEDTVTIGSCVRAVEGTSIYLVEGEEVILNDLVRAMMLNSANDAAVAIAEHIAGSVEGFAAMMNEEARRIGAVNSHFVNPNGLHEDDHYSTARDLSLIARAAIQDLRFRELVSTRTGTIIREDPETVTNLVNTNKLLWSYEGATGIKTGYTSRAKRCLVGLAERDGRELLTVVLKNEEQTVWSDTANLLNYGFDEFVSTEVVSAGMKVGHAPVVVGNTGLDLVASETLRWVFPVRNPDPVIRSEIVLDGELKAPIGEGETVGRLVLNHNGKELGTVPVIAGNDVSRPIQTLWYFWVGVVFAGLVMFVYAMRFVVRTVRTSQRMRR